MPYFEVREFVKGCVVRHDAAVFDFVHGLPANPNDVALRLLASCELFDAGL
jgi:hypothetical protein